MSRHIEEIHNDKNIHLGGGMLFLGDKNTSFDELDLYSVGCIQADATLTITTTKTKFPAGSPSALIKQDIKDLGMKLVVTLQEFEINKFNKVLGGLWTVTSTTPYLESVVDETIYLYGNNWHHTQGHSFTNDPVTASLNVYGGASYTENIDFEIDRTRGLIRRINNNIPEGQEISINYTWSKPTRKTMGIGIPDDCLGYYPVRFVVPKCDHTNRIFDMFKAYIDNDEFVLDFSNENFTKLQVTFNGAQDLTRTPSQSIGRYIEEESLNY